MCCTRLLCKAPQAWSIKREIEYREIFLLFKNGQVGVSVRFFPLVIDNKTFLYLPFGRALSNTSKFILWNKLRFYLFFLSTWRRIPRFINHWYFKSLFLYGCKKITNSLEICHISGWEFTTSDCRYIQHAQQCCYHILTPKVVVSNELRFHGYPFGILIFKKTAAW